MFDFDGATYCRELDERRLNTLLGRVWELMRDGSWRTLSQISLMTGGTEASVSARLRDFRKQRFAREWGVERVERKRISGGLWVYRLLV